jgi:hypothetical protein
MRLKEIIRIHNISPVRQQHRGTAQNRLCRESTSRVSQYLEFVKELRISANECMWD